MRIFFEPKVILVARPSLVAGGVHELLAEYGLGADGWKRGPMDTDGDGLAELMGRLCYGSVGANQGRVGATDYMLNILESGHGSVLEHACWSFVVCRASRGFTHQVVRHRAGWAFSQESTHFIRYGDEEARGVAEAGVCLTGLPEQLHDVALDALRGALWAYEQLWAELRAEFPEDAKVKKLVSGSARGLLPTGVESRLGFTANARALRHFCETRGGEENTPEIRLVAARVAAIMMVEAPAMFQDFVVWDDVDGLPSVASAHGKV